MLQQDESAPDEPAIVLRGVRRSFGSKPAVSGMDLTVPRGTICGFLGPNGAGKTTTIRMLMGMLRPDGGSVRVLGSDASTARARIGYLPEERGVYRRMRVGGFLSYVARLKGVSSRGLGARIDSWLGRVDLPGVRHKRCEELSKGMQQKVQFVAAVLHEPDLVILDEPFSGLDPVNAILLRDLISEFHASGRTVLFSTHVLAAAEALCDRVVLVHQGRKAIDGPLEEVRARFDPRQVLVEAFPGAAARVRGALVAASGISSVSDVDGVFCGALAADADPHAVVRSVASAGSVRRIELARASLEDVFVRVVGESVQAAAARAAAPAAGGAL